MKQNIILELDSFYIDRVVQWFKNDETHRGYNIYVLTKNSKHNRFVTALSSYSHVTCLTYDDLFSYTTKTKLDIDKYHQFNKYFFNNHLTARFLDRSGYYPEYGIGVQNAFTNYAFAAHNLLLFLIDKKIDFISFRNTPHNMVEWLLLSTVEFLNLDVYTFEDFIFPWLFTIKKGCLGDTELLFEDIELNDKDEIRNHIKKCIKINSGNYENAIPLYEKSRRGKGVFKHFNPFLNLRSSILKPHQIINKTRNYFYYKKWSKKHKLDDLKYMVFFMHFQPERSTLPEAYDFVDQFYTIKILSMMLPENVKLLVKEHPSMFTKISEPKARNPYNYKLIKDLTNVEFVSMDMDSFSLIDNALAVISSKGTVSLEAYMRHKPVIMFGKTNLKLPGVYNFESIDGLQEHINKIISDQIKVDNTLHHLTEACYKVASSGLTKSPEEMENYSFTRDNRENATYVLLSKLLKHKLK